MLQAKIYMKLLILSKRMVNYEDIKNNLKQENKHKKTANITITLKTLLFKPFLAQITKVSKNLLLAYSLIFFHYYKLKYPLYT